MLFRLSSITGNQLKSSRSNLALTLLAAKSAATTFTDIKSKVFILHKAALQKYLHKVYNILTLEEKKIYSSFVLL
jgi:hypothetical protein